MFLVWKMRNRKWESCILVAVKTEKTIKLGVAKKKWKDLGFPLEAEKPDL